ncbi:MAG: hypothetical protein L0226_03210 [Acidobacteria bacterium]|nr:hypothetical protein [Acidobacteriota bacterium]
MHFTQVRAGETPQQSKLKVTAYILGVSDPHHDSDNRRHPASSEKTKLDNELVSGYFDWVLCPVDHREILYWYSQDQCNFGT